MTPREWGTLGHIGLAHQFTRWGAARAPLRSGDRIVSDPEEVLPRSAAITKAVSVRGFHADVATSVRETVDKWLDKHPEPAGRARGVEILFRSVLGYLNGKFGLWVVADPPGGWRDHGTDMGAEREYLLNFPERNLIHVSGGLIEPVRLRLRRRFDGSLLGWDGLPSTWDDRLIWMTRRFDLLQMPSTYTQVLDLWDHKFSAKFWHQDIADAYEMDEQFCAARLMLDQVAGPVFGCRPGAVRLNHVHRRAPHVSAPSAIELKETAADARFPQTYHARWAQRALMDRDVPPSEWEGRGLENACTHKYGPCDAKAVCAGAMTHVDGRGSLAGMYLRE